jgi:DNA-binding HxlR family transcriptional regulator
MRELLNRIGDTWTLLIVLNLGAGKQRFSELRRHVKGISQRMLTQTLRHLEHDVMPTRTVFPKSH